MNAREILDQLARLDIAVRAQDGLVVLRPAAAVPAALVPELRAAKPALLAYLSTAGAVYGPRVVTPDGPGLLRWRGHSGRLGVVLDGDPDAWHFYDPEVVRDESPRQAAG